MCFFIKSLIFFGLQAALSCEYIHADSSEKIEETYASNGRDSDSLRDYLKTVKERDILDTTIALNDEPQEIKEEMTDETLENIEEK